MLKKVQVSSLRAGMEQQKRMTKGWRDGRQGVSNPNFPWKLGRAFRTRGGGLSFKVRRGQVFLNEGTACAKARGQEISGRTHVPQLLLLEKWAGLL